MIKTDEEFHHSLKKLELSREAQRQKKAQLVSDGYPPDQIKRALDPVEGFLDQIQYEVDSYQRLKLGQLDEIKNFHNLGEMLIAARIALGLSTKDLADKLGIDEAQVLLNEKNNYYDQANQILDAMGVVMTSHVVRASSLARSA